MFDLNGALAKIKGVSVTGVDRPQGKVFPVVKVKVEVAMETRTQLLDAVPEYAGAVESILDGAEEWEDKDHVTLAIKVERPPMAWHFDIERYDNDGEKEEYSIDMTGEVVGTPRLKIQPQKSTTLTFEISAIINEDDYVAMVCLFGAHRVRLYSEALQSDLFRGCFPEGTVVTVSADSIGFRS